MSRPRRARCRPRSASDGGLHRRDHRRGTSILTGLLLWLSGIAGLAQAGMIAMPAGTVPMPSYIAWPLAMNSLWLLLTLLLVADTGLRFDRIAGRMTQGGASLTYEDLLYGRPEVPVLIDSPENASQEAGWAEPALHEQPNTEIAQSA